MYRYIDILFTHSCYYVKTHIFIFHGTYSFMLTFCVATEYHLGLLKAKLAKYRAQLIEPSKSAGAKVCHS